MSSKLTPKLKLILSFMIVSFFVLLIYSAAEGAKAVPSKASVIISVAALIGLVYAFGVWLLYKSHRVLQGDLEESKHDTLTQERALAVETERTRLAREIHDTIAQGLSSIVMLTNSMKLDQRDEASQKKIDLIKSTAKENLEEARGIIKELTPAPLEGQSFNAAVGRICEQSIVPMKFQAENLNLPRAMETALLRMIQSLVANINQHSEATNGSVVLTQAHDNIVLEVADNGKGIDSEKGFGLSSIEQRVDELGGEISIENQQGTNVTVTLPLKGKE